MFDLPKRIRCGIRHLVLAVATAASCLATNVAASGLICTSDDTFIFGNRAVGSSTTATATVTNCGDAPWSFTDVSVHPATGPAFHPSSTCTTGLTLAPGATCTATIQFAPTMPGQTSGGIWLHNTTSTPDQLITFYGRGVDAQSGSASLTFAPASLNFATQTVGTASAPFKVELRNQGSVKLVLSAIILNGPEVYDFDYGADGTCEVGGTIAAGGSCLVSLYFRPQGPGIRRANLVIDSPQLASLAIMQVAGVAQVGAAQPGAAPNYTGLFEKAPAGSEPGWGIHFSHQGDIIFATWFTYNADGMPYWLSMAAQRQADGSFTGAIDLTSGPLSSVTPYDPTRVTHTTVGTGRLTFSNVSNGVFSYTIDGAFRVESLTLFVFGAPVPTCTFDGTLPASLADNYQGIWAVANLAESGWGINFAHQGDVIVASWAMYDESGAPSWVSAALRKTAPRTYTGALDSTTGPPINSVPFDPSRVTHRDVGSATVTFTDGNNGIFAYTLNGISQSKAVTQFVFRSPGTVCQ